MGPTRSRYQPFYQRMGIGGAGYIGELKIQVQEELETGTLVNLAKMYEIGNIQVQAHGESHGGVSEHWC